jgi:hypothetical protein
VTWDRRTRSHGALAEDRGHREGVTWKGRTSVSSRQAPINPFLRVMGEPRADSGRKGGVCGQHLGRRIARPGRRKVVALTQKDSRDRNDGDRERNWTTHGAFDGEQLVSWSSTASSSTGSRRNASGRDAGGEFRSGKNAGGLDGGRPAVAGFGAEAEEPASRSPAPRNWTERRSRRRIRASRGRP